MALLKQTDYPAYLNITSHQVPLVNWTTLNKGFNQPWTEQAVQQSLPLCRARKPGSIEKPAHWKQVWLPGNGSISHNYCQLSNS
jgi:hypothetical protein